MGCILSTRQVNSTSVIILVLINQLE